MSDKVSPGEIFQMVKYTDGDVYYVAIERKAGARQDAWVIHQVGTISKMYDLVSWEYERNLLDAEYYRRVA